MKALIILMLFIVPLREVEDVRLTLPNHQEALFSDYANDNFSQKLTYDKQKISAEIQSMNFLHLELNFRIFPDEAFLAKLDPQTREIILNLFDSSTSFGQFFKNLSLFLKENIKYTEENLPQDAVAVMLNKKAHCVGYANLTRLLLQAVGVENRLVKGFYLKETAPQTLTPIPHRWLEIRLADGSRFFYDPQRQLFSANYLVTNEGVDFTRVKKFYIHLVKRSKKIVN